MKQIWSSLERCLGQSRLLLEWIWLNLNTQSYSLLFKVITNLANNRVKKFYHIWAMWQFWLSDKMHLQRVFSLWSLKALNEFGSNLLSDFAEKDVKIARMLMTMIKGQNVLDFWCFKISVFSLFCLCRPIFRKTWTITNGDKCSCHMQLWYWSWTYNAETQFFSEHCHTYICVTIY